MTNYLISNIDLSKVLWLDSKVSQTWAAYLIGIDRKLHAIAASVCFEHHGPGHTSGCTWDLFVDEKGKVCDIASSPGPRWPKGVSRWRIALSYRASLITAISWSDPEKREDDVTDLKLVALAKEIATDLSPLIYMDQHELRALEIPWDELQGDANMRLDWSEMPNAFNLLFYEY
ncbi:MAG: hypothetical protein HEQ39_08905 [Rhizobacter sp.]